MSPDALLPVAFILGYLLGSIPFGLILTRLAGTQDLRSIGSGNIGATNVLRTGRKGLAAATLLCDMLKGTRRGASSPAISAAPTLRCWRRSAPSSAISFRSGSKFQGRQGRRGLYRRADRPVLAGRVGVLRAVARDRRRSRAIPRCRRWSQASSRPIFLWWFGHLGAGRAVRRADAAAVLHAPRKHQAVAGGHRGTDRAEVDGRIPGVPWSALAGPIQAPLADPMRTLEYHSSFPAAGDPCSQSMDTKTLNHNPPHRRSSGSTGCG